MAQISRRGAGKLLLAGSAGLLLPRGELRAASRIDSVVRGVQLGAQSYSFRDRPLDRCIEAYVTTRLGECELWQEHVEPGAGGDLKWQQRASREELRHWRLSTPLSHFHDIRRQFDNAGVLLYAYNYSFTKDLSEAEIERGFQMAEALGVRYITSSGNISVIPIVDRYAQKYRVTVGNHGHDQTDKPDEFSTAATFAAAMKGSSRYIGVNLDIGHFTAAGGDAVAYLREHHDRIVTLHIKDRKKNHGPNVPFGAGDTPIQEVLWLLRDNRWKIPANIEYEYGKPGMDTIAEVERCYTYCRRALDTVEGLDTDRPGPTPKK